MENNEEMINNEIENEEENIEEQSEGFNAGVFLGGVIAGGLLAYAVGGGVKKIAGKIHEKIKTKKAEKAEQKRILAEYAKEHEDQKTESEEDANNK